MKERDITLDTFTLSSYNQTRHAVRHTCPCCQEGYAHDVVWDVQCEADDGDLIETYRKYQDKVILLAYKTFKLAQFFVFVLIYKPTCRCTSHQFQQVSENTRDTVDRRPTLTIHTMRQEKTAIHKVEATKVTMNQRCQRGRMQLGTVQQSKRPRGHVITHFTRAHQPSVMRQCLDCISNQGVNIIEE